MRRRPLFWLLISVLCFAGARYSWRLGNQRTAEKAPSATQPRSDSAFTDSTIQRFNASSTPSAITHHASRITNAFPYRLSNTTKSLAQLSRSDHAILLENVLL